MAEFRDSIDIAAPPETVFEYLTTDSGMTAWMGQYADHITCRAPGVYLEGRDAPLSE